MNECSLINEGKTTRSSRGKTCNTPDSAHAAHTYSQIEFQTEPSYRKSVTTNMDEPDSEKQCSHIKLTDLTK